ncbi:MAG: four helix bundle protein, partial [Verrucomicrobiota bacterium]
MVWQKAHQLTLAVYKMTQGYPRAEIYGLTSQMRRTAVSVPSNVAEGFHRSGKADRW